MHTWKNLDLDLEKLDLNGPSTETDILSFYEFSVFSDVRFILIWLGFSLILLASHFDQIISLF